MKPHCYTVFYAEQVEGLPVSFYAMVAPALSDLERIAAADRFFAAPPLRSCCLFGLLACRDEIRQAGDLFGRLPCTAGRGFFLNLEQETTQQDEESAA